MARPRGNACWPAPGRFRRPGAFRSPPIPSSCLRRGSAEKPYGTEEPGPFSADDPLGWQVSEYEEAFELRPGLEHLAAELLLAMAHLGHGRPAHGISRGRLEGNPFWPPELAERAGTLGHERYVVLAPLALSRTQDDKGRVRWTLFGGSEQGPARAFWQGFWTAPGRELPADGRLPVLLSPAQCGLWPSRSRGQVTCTAPGSESCPAALIASLPYAEERLPVLDDALSLSEGGRLGRTKYLLTFRPFGQLAEKRAAGLSGGRFAAIAFPGSLSCFGARRHFFSCAANCRLAMQIPLLDLFPRRENPFGLRVPQAGWMHEPHPDHPVPDPDTGPHRNTFRRTHRWGRIHRHEDELAVADGEDHVAHVLFSTLPDDLGLYDKPMARNAQIWTHEFRLLLDGPRARPRGDRTGGGRAPRGRACSDIASCIRPCAVGRYEVYWHRPLVACLSAKTGKPEVFVDGPLGYLTAYDAGRPNPARAIELWPRVACPRAPRGGGRGFLATPEHHQHRISRQQRPQLLDAWELLGGQPLPRSFARAMLNLPHEETARPVGWIASTASAEHAAAGRPNLAAELAGGSNSETRRIGPGPSCRRQRFSPGGAGMPLCPAHFSPHRPAILSKRPIGGRSPSWPTANTSPRTTPTASHDPVTPSAARHHHRDLEALGDLLAGLLPPARREAGHGRSRRRRRSAVSLADRFRLSLARRLARQSAGRRPRSATWWW